MYRCPAPHGRRIRIGGRLEFALRRYANAVPDRMGRSVHGRRSAVTLPTPKRRPWATPFVSLTAGTKQHTDPVSVRSGGMRRVATDGALVLVPGASSGHTH